MNQSYVYDELNRLSSATETGAWSQTYDYDRYGNRAVRNTSYMPSPQLTPQSASSTDFTAFDQSNNRLSQTKFPNVAYDGAGNLTRDIVASTFSYDGENRQVTSSVGGTTASYFYDGDGRRVKKVVGTVTTVFVYNVAGQLIAEYTTDPVPPAAGGGGTSYLTADHLGSTRVVTGSDGTVKARYDYLPFGEEIAAGIGNRSTFNGYSQSDGLRQKFTSKERDTESGLDYFLARYYSSAQGRFTSADEPFAGQREDDPQSWNLFAYARNNPLIYVDPTGQDYLIYDEKGKFVKRVTDAQLGELPPVKSSSSDAGVVHFANGSIGYFVDAPVNNDINVQAPRYTPSASFVSGFLSAFLWPYLLFEKALGVETHNTRVLNEAASDNPGYALAGSIVGGAASGKLIGALGSEAGTVSLFGRIGPGAGQGGRAGTFGSLNGLSRQEADEFLRSLGPTRVNTTSGGYTHYRFADASEVVIRPNGEIIRVPSPQSAPGPGWRIDPNGSFTRNHNTGERVY